MKYTIFVSRTYDKSRKQLSLDAAEALEQEILNLVDNPRRGEALRHDFRGLWSLHLRYKNNDYRAIYSIDDTGKRIEVHYVGSRENLYRQLRRLRLKAA